MQKPDSRHQVLLVRAVTHLSGGRALRSANTDHSAEILRSRTMRPQVADSLAM